MAWWQGRPWIRDLWDCPVLIYLKDLSLITMTSCSNSFDVFFIGCFTPISFLFAKHLLNELFHTSMNGIACLSNSKSPTTLLQPVQVSGQRMTRCTRRANWNSAFHMGMRGNIGRSYPDATDVVFLCNIGVRERTHSLFIQQDTGYVVRTRLGLLVSMCTTSNMDRQLVFTIETLNAWIHGVANLK